MGTTTKANSPPNHRLFRLVAILLVVFFISASALSIALLNDLVDGWKAGTIGLGIALPGAILTIVCSRLSVQVAHQATHDPLTGLPNRNLLVATIEQIVASERATDTRCGVMFLDLDGFKKVNDHCGHETGDTVLKLAAGRLLNAVRLGDLVARLGGDEFAIILPGAGQGTAHEVAGRIIDAFRPPFEVAGRSLAIGVSIGIALYPEHGRDSRSLLAESDQAMYSAKRTGGGLGRPRPATTSLAPGL